MGPNRKAIILTCHRISLTNRPPWDFQIKQHDTSDSGAAIKNETFDVTTVQELFCTQHHFTEKSRKMGSQRPRPALCPDPDPDPDPLEDVLCVVFDEVFVFTFDFLLFSISSL